MIEDKLSEEYKDFLCYISTKCENDSAWKFWKEFVFWDGFSHLYFFSIRGGMWNLRTASIKTMAPMFTAFVRPHYQKLIPQHLKTCWQCLNLSSTSFGMEPLCAAFWVLLCILLFQMRPMLPATKVEQNIASIRARITAPNTLASLAGSDF